MKDIKELALKVAKEMNWRMDEMTLETFATRLIAAYCEGQEPVLVISDYKKAGRVARCTHTKYGETVSLPSGTKLFTAPPEPASKETALSKYKRLEVEYETTDPVERLRAFCSFAMDGQDWLDVEPFLDAMIEPAPLQKFPAKPAGPEDQKIYDSIAANYNKGAAPSSEEVTKMVARLYGDLDGGPSSWLKQEAAAFIERLAARVDDLKQANDGLATAGILPDGCVVVPREATDEMLLAAESVKQYELSTPRLRWEAMIAAGEVKP